MPIVPPKVAKASRDELKRLAAMAPKPAPKPRKPRAPRKPKKRSRVARLDKAVLSRGRGAPPKLVMGKAILDLLHNCGVVACTQYETASILGVSEDTLQRFWAANPTAKDTWQRAQSLGKQSLRRAQFKTAVDDGNPTAQIWLGKNWLGQTDKQEITRIGEGVTLDLTTLEDDEVDQLVAILRKLGRGRAGYAAGPAPAGTIAPPT